MSQIADVMDQSAVVALRAEQARPSMSEAPASTAGPSRRAGLPFSPRSAVMVLLAIALAVAGATVIAMPKSSVATDAAYITADSTTVAPLVRGPVLDVLVGHNQPVKKGDALVRIDPQEFDARVASAQADLANALAALASSQAALSGLGAEQKLDSSNISVAQTAIAAADAENARAQADRQRFEDLLAKGYATRRDVDQARATAQAAQSNADHARAALAASSDQTGVTQAKRGTLAAQVASAQASVARAQAALDLAHQDQSHTVIYAPIDGVVGNRQVEPGDYVQPGARLLSIVPNGAIYVTANFKETQTGRMTVGQKATIKVDALPGRTFTGKVDSFSPASGSQFSLLPFEPATGNFTKIVQRVPVRIRLDPNQPGAERLRAGLSTTVKVALK